VPSGLQLNRYCTSGLDAINLAAAKIAAGWDHIALAGGVESMSRAPMGSDGGPLMYDPEVMLRQQYLPQGVAADLIATREGYSRSELDAFALRSQENALQAREKGYFQSSLIPICDVAGLPVLTEDETPRSGLTLERLSELRPSFARLGADGFASMALHKYPGIAQLQHFHTAGNSSALADGAALVLLADEATGRQQGWSPRARIVSSANASVDATICLTGTVPATEKALQRAGLLARDIDLWECNEAFASVAYHFQRSFRLKDGQFNVNGGAIALGHPLGATGTILLGTLLDELERRDLRRGLVTLCGGGGLATATIIERV
jgi:acetyl-CoA C-acetyltransferase